MSDSYTSNLKGQCRFFDQGVQRQLRTSLKSWGQLANYSKLQLFSIQQARMLISQLATASQLASYSQLQIFSIQQARILVSQLATASQLANYSQLQIFSIQQARMLVSQLATASQLASQQARNAQTFLRNELLYKMTRLLFINTLHIEKVAIVTF